MKVAATFCIFALSLVEASKPGTSIACEDSYLQLSCPKGGKLKIIWANFGRSKRSVCSNNLESPESSALCYDDKAIDKLRLRCEGKNYCKVAANRTIFGDPCPGTRKYLEAFYECEDSVKVAEVCERGEMSLSCRPGTQIYVIDGNYGRNGEDSCRQNEIKTNRCIQTKSVNVLRLKCNGRESCTVQATSEVFGDPCPGTFKLLKAVYACLKTEETSFAGRYENMFLKCPANHILHITAAREICYLKTYHHVIASTASCLSQTRDKCEGRQECSVRAANDAFDDPCLGKPKKLEVTYTCTPVELHYNKYTEKVCEGKKANLTCPPGHVLDIRKALYGRGDTSVCLSGPSKKALCPPEKVVKSVQERCQGRESCELSAIRRSYDLCPGTSKYLDVSYSCLESSSGLKIACQNYEMHLQCPTGQTLIITEANYGRLDPFTCASFDSSNDLCENPATLPIAKRKCDGKNFCTLRASSEEFMRNPCPGTEKYLLLKYYCAEPFIEDKSTTFDFPSKFSTIFRGLFMSFWNNLKSALLPWPAYSKVKGKSASYSSQEFISSADDVLVLQSEWVVCESEQKVISCSPDEVIKILQAEFGRTDQDVCVPANISSPCQADGLEALQKQCGGMMQCQISANSESFGDPCPGISKYLVFSYECVAKEKPAVNIACQGETANLFCPPEERILVEEAMYGRMDSKTCSKGPAQSTTCSSSSSLKVLKWKCDGKQRCSVQASNEIFGNPCSNTTKYLAYKYQCVKRNDGEEYCCQDESLHLACSEGQSINVQSAFYGRKDNTTCVGSPIKNGPFKRSGTSLKKVVERCQGRRECSIPASNKVFGNPGNLGPNVLEVKYKCEHAQVLSGRKLLWFEEERLLEPQHETNKEETGIVHAVCEGESVVMYCSPGKEVYATEGNYGRTDRKLCLSESETDEMCIDPNTTSTVNKICGGKNECTISLKKDFNHSPCKKPDSYLSLTYICMDKVKSNVEITVCDRTKTSLKCASDEFIRILSLETSNTEGNDTTCGTASSLTFLKDTCQGKKECHIAEENMKLGASCQSEYVQIMYNCLKGQ